MSDQTCSHRFCCKPVLRGYAYYKQVLNAAGEYDRLPFHRACAYAHPDYDVSQGCGAPFTTITGPAGRTAGSA